jgi:hypothetical protein
MALNVHERKILEFLGVHLLGGVAAALVFGGAILAMDIGHIRTLALQSANPVLALVVLFWGLIVTFGGLGMGMGIMSLSKDDDG